MSLRKELLSPMKKIIRLVCLVLYYGITKNLPEHSLPRGKLWLLLRRWTAKPILRHCGKEVHINRGVHFGNGSTFSLGDHGGLGFNTRIIGDVTMGNYVGTAHNVMITASNRNFMDLDQPLMFQGKRPDAPVVIDDDVLIFANAIVLPGVHIHSGCVIGAGAVVSRDVPPNAIVVGNPARIVKWRKKPEPGTLTDKMTPVADPSLLP